MQGLYGRVGDKKKRDASFSFGVKGVVRGQRARFLWFRSFCRVIGKSEEPLENLDLSYQRSVWRPRHTT